MSEVTEFQVLQLKGQLETSLENYGSDHKDSLKLLLQYSNILGQYASQQEFQKSIQLYTQSYQLLLPADPPNLLIIQTQYWRILIMISIKLSQAQHKNGQSQQSLNVLLQVQNLLKKQKKITPEWSNNVQLECLYFHLALAWKRIQNKERAQAMANECILLIRQNLKINYKEKDINMLIHMFSLQAQFKKNNLHQQLDCYNQMHGYCSQYLGSHHKATMQALMKVNQVKSQILFEQEIDNYSIKDFAQIPQQPIQSQMGFYDEESQEIFKENIIKKSRRQLTATDKQLNSIKQSLLTSPQSRQVSNDSYKRKYRVLKYNRNSADELKKFTDILITPTTQVRSPQQQGESKMYFWINNKKLNGRTKTETSQGRTMLSRDHPTPNLRVVTSPKTEQSVNLSFLQDKKLSTVNLNTLLLQRPKSTACFKRMSKQLNLKTEPQLQQQQQQQQQQVKPKDLFLKRSTFVRDSTTKQAKNSLTKHDVQHLNLDKEWVIQHILPPELSNREDFESKTQQSSDLKRYESEFDAAVRIQRYYRMRSSQRKQQDYNNRTTNHKKTILTNNKGNSDDDEDHESFNSMIMSLRVKPLSGYKRSNTTQFDQQIFPKRKSPQVPGSCKSIKLKKNELGDGAQNKQQLLYNKIEVIQSDQSNDSNQINQSEQQFQVNFGYLNQVNVLEYNLNQNQIYCLNFKETTIQITKLNIVVQLTEGEEPKELLLLNVYIQHQQYTHILKIEVNYDQFSNKIRKSNNDTYLLVDEILKQYCIKSKIQGKLKQTVIILKNQNQLTEIQLEHEQQMLLSIAQILYFQEIHSTNVGKSIKLQQSPNIQLLKEHYRTQQIKLKKFLLFTPTIQQKARSIEYNEEESFDQIGLNAMRPKRKFKRTKNVILFTIKAHKQTHPPQPPTIPLMLLEDMDDSPKMLEMSQYKDIDQNRIQLKTIMNGTAQRRKSHLTTSQNPLASSQHQTKKKPSTPTSMQHLFKKTLTIEQQGLLTFGEPKFHRQDVQFINGFDEAVESESSLDTKRVISNSERVKQLDKIQFDDDQQKQQEQLEQQEWEDEQQRRELQTVYQSQDPFIVSPNWKLQRKKMQYQGKVYSFQDRKIVQKFKMSNIYLNPFQENEKIFKSILKTDKTYFQVVIQQILLKQTSNFNQTFISQKDAIEIKLIYKIIRPISRGWDYHLSLKFKEFFKWFVTDFSLPSYVKNCGLTSSQKLQVLLNLQKYVYIQDSKLKIKFYQPSKNKENKQNTRQKLMQYQSLYIEKLTQRDHLQEQLYKILEECDLLKAYNQIIDQKNQPLNQYHENENPLIKNPDFIDVDYYSDVQLRTIVIPKELKQQYLQEYNTIRRFQSSYAKLRINNYYLIFQNNILKTWNPFKKIIWKIIQFPSVEKFINAYQSPMRVKLIDMFLRVKHKLIGNSLIFQKQLYSYQQPNKQSEYLYQCLQNKNSSISERYHQIQQFKYALINQLDERFWRNYYHKQTFQSHSKINGIGECIVQINSFARSEQFYILINIFPLLNMKTQQYKIAMTDMDLSLITSTKYNQFQSTYFKEIQKILQKYIAFRKIGLYKRVEMRITNNKSNHIQELVSSFPWLNSFDYDQFNLTPYSIDNHFFHIQTSDLKVVCHTPKFISIPQQIQSLSKGEYIDYYIQDDPSPKQYSSMASVVTIMKSVQLQIFFIQIYFPSTQRKLLAQINYSDISFKQQNLSFQFKDSIKKNNSQKLWLQLIDGFKIQFTSQNKILLIIEKLNIKCILQEVIHYEVKQTLQDHISILFVFYIENKQNQELNIIDIIERFARLSVQEAKNYKLYLKMFWMQHPIKMQSYRLPLQDLMVGYFNKIQTKQQLFDYRFNMKDIIKICQACIENLIMNFSTQIFNNSLQFILPQEVVNSNKNRIKLNATHTGIFLNKSDHTLIHRGVLMNQPQIIVGIYNQISKERINFYVQTLSNGSKFIYKVKYDQIENLIPGFRSYICHNIETVGIKLFKAYKNTLILKSYYYANQ